MIRLVPPAQARVARQRTTTSARYRAIAGMGAATAMLLGTLAAPALAAPSAAGQLTSTVTVPQLPISSPFAPQYPSADDIERAQESEAATAAAVGDIEGILAAAQVSLAGAQVEALKAQSAYNESLISQQERQATADAAQAEADAAADLYAASKIEVGQLAGDLYRGGGVTPGLTALLVGGESSDDFLYRASTMHALTANRSETLTDAQTAAAVWAAQQISAGAAQSAADDAAQTAEAAKTEAQRSADAQSALVAESAAKRDVLIEQLATLQGTTVELQEKRIAGIERKQQQEALAAAIAASAQQAAEDAAKQQGSEARGPSTTGLQSNDVNALPSAPADPTPSAPRDPAPPSISTPVLPPRPAVEADVSKPEPKPEPKPRPEPERTPPPAPPAPPAPSKPAPVKPAPPKPAPVKPAPSPPPSSGFSSSVMVNYAMSKVGVGHYQWGGNGPLGFDCSGLIRQAFQAAGKNIARGGTEQFWNAPVRVPLSQARYGDIIAFGSGPFYHVAIYLGNNKIVHALNPRQGIMVNDLSELIGMQPYYLAARY